MRRLYTLATGIFAATTLFPCAVDTSPSFFPRQMPEPANTGFAKGQLGIVTPDLTARYELIAWRYLAGLPLSEEEQTAALPPHGPGAMSKAVENWQKARVTVPGIDAPKVPTYYVPWKASTRKKGAFYTNCLDDAFVHATATLEDRKARYPGNDATAAWVQAQDQVFENCSKAEPVYPAEPDAAAASPLERDDRLYQIAAAHFYAEDLDGAESRFRALAAQPKSVWAGTARYMVARTLIRKHSLGEDSEALEKARAELESVKADPAATSLHASAEALIAYVGGLIDPSTIFAPLAASLKLAHPGAALQQTMADSVYVLTSERLAPVVKTAALPEPFDWVKALDSRKADRSIERWNADRSLPWLVASLVNANGDEDAAPALIAAGLAVPETSRAYDTARFNSIRLLIEGKERARALKALEAVLTGAPRTPESVDNAYRAERMKLANSYQDWLKWAPRHPVAYAEEFGGDKIDNDQVLDNDSIHAFNFYIPLEKLAATVEASPLPAWTVNDLAMVAWTRAFLLGNNPVADRMSAVVKKAHPQWSVDIDVFTGASGDEKRFAGALLIARHPEFGPRVWLEFRKRTYAETLSWWCTLSPPKNDESARPTVAWKLPAAIPLPDSVVSPAERETAQREAELLRDSGSTQSSLGAIVLPWSKGHPADPRVPEALGRLVRITRLGCRSDEATGAVSKAAFDVLHQKYPGNQWTNQTPYWFK